MNNEKLQILIEAIINQKAAKAKLDAQIKQIKLDAIKVGLIVDDKQAKAALKQVEKAEIAAERQANKEYVRSRTFAIKQIEQRNQQRIKAEAEAEKQSQKEYVNSYKAKIRALEQSQITSTKKPAALNEFDDFFRINTKAAKIYKDQIAEVRTQLENAHDPKTFKEATQSWRNLRSEIKKNGDLGTSVFGSMLKEAKKFVGWMIASGGVMLAINTVRKMINNVRELDTAMTELRKVTDETNDMYSSFLNRASKSAVELGSTITDLVNATASYARLGFGLDDSTKLAEVSTIYKNVGDFENGLPVQQCA